MTLTDLRGRATITVPEAAELLGVGRNSAYDAARAGDIPTLRIGRRLVVPTHRLLHLLGVPVHDDAPAAGTGEGEKSSTHLAGEEGRHAPA
ncbi:helix-turn-helix domain-containing protein [Euzebya sp.]|uniref:helix-turn-helix domain-containing protein n=1 Tax=Euzebya sp. TaxID=1971409 RepID=UPI003514E3E3